MIAFHRVKIIGIVDRIKINNEQLLPSSESELSIPYFLQIARIIYVCFVYFAAIAQVWINLHPQHVMSLKFYTCHGVKGEPSPTWLRKNWGEDEEETGRNGQSRSWRFSFHKYFTTFFFLFLFIDYFYSIIFFYTFFTHNLHPRPTTSTHYPRPTKFSYNHCKYITLHYTINFKVFRYSFSEAIPIFFNRLKSVFFLALSL